MAYGLITDEKGLLAQGGQLPGPLFGITLGLHFAITRQSVWVMSCAPAARHRLMLVSAKGPRQPSRQ